MNFSKELQLLKRNKIRFILVLIIASCTVLLILPIVPALKPVQQIDEPNYPVSYVKALDSNDEEKVYLTDGNRLFIPKIGVETKILEGNSLDVLLKEEGVWREPDTLKPGTFGNMTLAGHRFQYIPPNTATLYNLDKLQIDDEVRIYWEGKELKYKINRVFEVNPDEVWIKDQPTDAEEITIYTCTPIYTSEKRLVIKAKLI